LGVGIFSRFAFADSLVFVFFFSARRPSPMKLTVASYLPPLFAAGGCWPLRPDGAYRLRFFFFARSHPFFFPFFPPGNMRFDVNFGLSERLRGFWCRSCVFFSPGLPGRSLPLPPRTFFFPPTGRPSVFFPDLAESRDFFFFSVQAVTPFWLRNR